MTELKPCPLCGGKVSLERKMDGAYSFDCQRCGLDARLPECLDEVNKGTSIEAWNTRYEPTCRLEEADDDYTETSWVRCSKCQSCYPNICTVYRWFSGTEVEEIREEVVRCRDCETFHENATPNDLARPHFCSKLGIDLEDGNGFCKWGVKDGD